MLKPIRNNVKKLFNNNLKEILLKKLMHGKLQDHYSQILVDMHILVNDIKIKS